MLRRATVVLAALVLAHSAVGTAVADDSLVVEMKIAPPAKYGPLVWKFGEKLTPGFWYTNDQIVAVSKRLDYLEIKAAKECVDAQIATDKTVGTWWKIGAGILVGAGLGYCAGHAGHCGIAK